MKVILIENIKGTGKKDEIKDLKDGFASFLIKSKKAVAYTQKSNEVLASQIKERKETEEELILSCTKLKEKLETMKLVFKVNTGANGKVFGSITTKQISEELEKKKINVDKKIIEINNINTLGTHIAKINLHKKVVANLEIVLEEVK